MKRLIIILLVLSMNVCYAIRAVTKEENHAYLRSLGLNNSKIEKLEELNLEYNKKMNDALEKSRKYQKNGLCKTKDECNKYTHKLVSDIDKDYEKKLNKIMNFWQKKKYLEYRSIVY